MAELSRVRCPHGFMLVAGVCPKCPGYKAPDPPPSVIDVVVTSDLSVGEEFAQFRAWRKAQGAENG